MDLRPYKVSEEQLWEASDLACRGLLCYQPFMFADDMVTGAGYEFDKNIDGPGLVYTTRISKDLNLNSPGLIRHLIDHEIAGDFVKNNQQLDKLYQSMINLTLEHMGDPSGLTFGDVGSNCGYFPLELARRGAKRTVGFDIENYEKPYALLNEIMGTNAEFRHVAYDPKSRKIANAGQFDVVFSVAVLVHLSDPLAHLAFLGTMAKKALFVWTSASQNDGNDLVVRYKCHNKYYEDSKFPHCFDVVVLSPAMLKKSLELMGFTDIYELENTEDGLNDTWFKKQKGYLAIRPDVVE